MCTNVGATTTSTPEMLNYPQLKTHAVILVGTAARQLTDVCAEVSSVKIIDDTFHAFLRSVLHNHNIALPAEITRAESLQIGLERTSFQFPPALFNRTFSRGY